MTWMNSKSKPKFDHIGIVVKNAEKTLQFLSELLDLTLPSPSSSGGKVFRIFDAEDAGFRWVLVPTDGRASAMIELLQPLRESHLSGFLKTSGDMAVAEICFRVDDIKKFYDKVKEMGLTPVDSEGKPLVEQRYFVIPFPGLPDEYSLKCFYINMPLRQSQGPAIEILEYPPVFEEKLEKFTRPK